MTKIDIFCISLLRAKERRKFIQKEWIDKLQLDIKFWDAYDRKDIENNKFIYPYYENLAIKKIGRKLSCGELACSTSFALAIKNCIENKIREAIFMEDDVHPLIGRKSILFDMIKYSREEFNHTNIVILHHPMINFKDDDKRRDAIYFHKKDKFSLCKNTPWGNYLMYMNEDGMKEFYDELIKMDAPADHPQKILAKKDLVCITNYPLAYHENRTTYIGNDIRKTRRVFIP